MGKEMLSLGKTIVPHQINGSKRMDAAMYVSLPPHTSRKAVRITTRVRIFFSTYTLHHPSLVVYDKGFPHFIHYC